MAVYEVDVLDTLAFGEYAGTNIKVVAVADSLPFTENDGGRNLHQTVADRLLLSDSTRHSMSTSRRVAQTLAFREQAGRMRQGYVYENLTIAQSADGGKGHAASSVLVFAESAGIYRGHDAADLLAFSELVALHFTRARTLLDALAFREYPVWWSEAPYPPSPPATKAKTVTLATAAGTVTLPAPDFEDKENVGQHRIQRATRGGTTIIFRADDWPTTDEFELEFSYLTEAQVASLRRVTAAGVGQLCTYTDVWGHARSVIVTSPEVSVSQAGRHNYKASLKVLVAS